MTTERRREIDRAFQNLLVSRMNQRRQDVLRAYHQMVLARVPEAHIRLAFEGRRIYDEWMAQWQ